MNYFDFLIQKFSSFNFEEKLNLKDIELDENKKDRALKYKEKLLFTHATKAQLKRLDFEKLLEKKGTTAEEQQIAKEKEEKKLSPLEFILKEFLSIKQIKESADKNHDGEITIEEAKEFIGELASKDGEEGLSLDDFDTIIKDLDINLEELLKQESTQEKQNETVSEKDNKFPVSENNQNTNTTPSTDNSVQTGPQNTTPFPIQESVTRPTPTDAQPAISSAQSSSPATTAKASSSRSVATKSSSIDSMSLEQLKTEKTAREKILTEKQKNLISAQKGDGAKTKGAKTEEKKAKDEYEKALKKDEAAKTFEKEVLKNNKELEENRQKLEKNAVEITKKENEIQKVENKISSLENELSALKEALASLSGVKETEDKDLQVKKSKLQKEISAKEKEISKQKENLNKLKKDLDSLQKEKTSLEETKNKLEQEKAKLDQKVKENCSEDTKLKLDAYNKARAHVEDVKNEEIKSAKIEVNTAQKAIAEIDTKIKVAKANEIKSKYSSTPVMSINNVPEKFRNKYGVTEKILPDGTKVLACKWSRFNKCQKEWIELQQPMLRAAKELGLTLVYSDVERTVAESNAGRAKKGNLVCKGGQSPHNYGVAADITLFKDNKPVSVNSNIQTEYAQLVKKYSNSRIEWGGDWRKKGERHHFNIRGWESKYKSPSNLVG